VGANKPSVDAQGRSSHSNLALLLVYIPHKDMQSTNNAT
jgi:hypothetical protein